MGSAEDAAILRAFYAEHQPQFASDAEVKRICTALRRAAQKKGLLEHRHISDFIFETVAAKNGGSDPRKWFASRQRRLAAAPKKRLSAAALRRHDDAHSAGGGGKAAPAGGGKAASAAGSSRASAGRRAAATAPSESGGSSTWSQATHDGNAKKKLSFFTYNKLVGDGGQELPKEEFAELVDKYQASWSDGSRLYVTWACVTPGRERECIRCKPNFLCLCGHRLNAHAWWDKSLQCRAPGCKCPGYHYMHKQGSFTLKCKCKHDAADHLHAGVLGPCRVPGCECAAFATTFACQCGAHWSEHAMTVETEAERAARGKPIDRESHKDRRKAARAKASAGSVPAPPMFLSDRLPNRLTRVCGGQARIAKTSSGTVSMASLCLTNFGATAPEPAGANSRGSARAIQGSSVCITQRPRYRRRRQNHCRRPDC
eukprot:COSAG04_NODE_2531_length_3971_cov_69.730630_2_plen_428_part_00